MSQVLLSYRRDDSKIMVDRIFAALGERFGEDNVFRDISSIEPGKDFRVALDRALQRADFVIVVIGEKWLDIADESGRRRLDNPQDYVLREIAAGIHQPNTEIVPVTIGRAQMPSAASLPDDIKELAFRQAVVVRPDPDFDVDIRRLIERIEPRVRKRGPILAAALFAAVLVLTAAIFFLYRNYAEREAARWQGNWQTVSQPLLRRGEPQSGDCAVQREPFIKLLNLNVSGDLAKMVDALRKYGNAPGAEGFFDLPYTEEMHKQLNALIERVRTSTEKATGQTAVSPELPRFRATIVQMNSLGEEVRDLQSEFFYGPLEPSRTGVAEWIEESISQEFPLDAKELKFAITVPADRGTIVVEPPFEPPDSWRTYYWYVKDGKKEHESYRGDPSALWSLVDGGEEVYMHFERPGYEIRPLRFLPGMTKPLEFVACPLGVLLDPGLAQGHLATPLSRSQRLGTNLFQIRTQDQLKKLAELPSYTTGEFIDQKVDKMNNNRLDFRIKLVELP